MLLQALGQNLANYERRFGTISGSQQDTFFDPKSGTLGGLKWNVGGGEPDGDDQNDKKDHS
jgi:hypothetical protein